jgi:hypothetical protein
MARRFGFSPEKMGFGMAEGKRLERDVFGSIKPTPEYKRAVLALYDTCLKENRKMSLEEAVGLIKKYQPDKWDPTNPAKPFLKDLKLEVGEMLGFSDEDLEKIEAYTAVDSVLDHSPEKISEYSADAVLIFKKGKDKEYYVTYDLTSEPAKTIPRNLKTILITDFVEPPEPGEENKEQEEAYMKKVQEVAKFTVEELRSSGFLS